MIGRFSETSLTGITSPSNGGREAQLGFESTIAQNVVFVVILGIFVKMPVGNRIRGCSSFHLLSKNDSNVNDKITQFCGLHYPIGSFFKVEVFVVGFILRDAIMGSNFRSLKEFL